MAEPSDMHVSENQSSAESGSDSEFEGFGEEGITLIGNMRYTAILNLDYNGDSHPKDVAANWTAIDTPSTIAPFTGNVGLTVNLAEDAAPIKFFKFLFNEDYWTKIVTEINNIANAKIAQPLSPQSRLQDWTPVNADKIKLFFLHCVF